MHRLFKRHNPRDETGSWIGTCSEGVFKFKELRASFATIAAREARIADVDIESYVGHAGSSVLRRHYIRMEQTLNDLVIKPIDRVFTDSVALGKSQH